MDLSKVLVVIPARGGSKGIPKKNSKRLGGKPLISYTIEAAMDLFPIENLCISTDDQEIKEIAESHGLVVPFMRPVELATDSASSQDVLLHAVDWYESNQFSIETVVLLQPTSPFRTSMHIKEAIDLYNPSTDMLVSVKESKANPYYNLFEENEESFLIKCNKGEFTRRQDCPAVYEYNGAIYVINAASMKSKKIAAFQRVGKYLMSDLDSIDVDTHLDWKIAECLMREVE